MIHNKSIFLIFWILSTLLPLQAQTDFSQENAYQLLKHLSVDIGPRPMGSPAERQALEFAIKKFKEYGCDTSYTMQFDRYSRGNTNSGVAVGIKRGATERIIVIGGHIDSAEPEVPGADDDGSGIAVVLETARILCKRQTQSTYVFCCFGGEEQGLLGSKYFISDFQEIDSVVLMLQIDMANGLGILDIYPDGHLCPSAPKWLVNSVAEEFYKLGYKNFRYPTHIASLNQAPSAGPTSDHEPFLQKGIPAIAFVTDISKPIHTPQDNFENFEPAGLKRSGDLVLKLTERFDNGVPHRELENYWLYLIGGTTIFIPYWGLKVFLFLTIVLSIITFILVRRKREIQIDPQRKIRWSGLKMYLLSIIIVACGWFSSDLIGWIRGARYPWFSDINGYIILSIIGLGIGAWISIRLTNKIHLSNCPYVFFKRAIIFLIPFLILCSIGSIKLTVEPTVALLFISLAILVRNPVLKLLFVGLAPWWMFRLIFSEWSDLFFRMSLQIDFPDPIISVIVNVVLFLLFTLYVLPFLFAVTAVIKDSDMLKTIVPKFRSVWTLVILSLCFIGYGTYLISKPVFNNLWQQRIMINQTYDMKKGIKEVSIQSHEYLKGLKIHYDGTDTTIYSNITKFEIPVTNNFDTTWVKVNRKEERQIFGDTTHFDIELDLVMKYRPYTLSISYSSDSTELRAFDTPYQFRTDKTIKKIEWYSFPDSLLIIPVKFSFIGSDSVKEKIEIVFDKLAYPIDVKGEMIYTVPKTKFMNKYSYQ